MRKHSLNRYQGSKGDFHWKKNSGMVFFPPVTAMVLVFCMFTVKGAAAEEEEAQTVPDIISHTAADFEPELIQELLEEAEEGDGIPEDRIQTHVVEKGDTLWDISNRYMGSPWYWPQLWSFNPDIANPHWIYPGNVIRILSPSALGPIQVLDEEGVAITDLDAVDEIVSSAGDLSYRVPESVKVIDQSFITREELEAVGQIIASFEEKGLLTRFDKVYIKTPDPVPGDRYIVFRTGAEVVHPHTGVSYGFRTELLGDLRITEAHPGDLATAIIGDTLDAVERGHYLIPWTDAHTRYVTRRENQVELEGIIIASLVPGQRILGQHQYLFIDRGTDHGVEIGNIFEVIRRGDPLGRYFPIDPEIELPWEIIGRILVVETQEETSTGLLLSSIREIEPGEPIRMRVDDQFSGQGDLTGNVSAQK